MQCEVCNSCRNKNYGPNILNTRSGYAHMQCCNILILYVKWNFKGDCDKPTKRLCKTQVNEIFNIVSDKTNGKDNVCKSMSTKICFKYKDTDFI